RCDPQARPPFPTRRSADLSIYTSIYYEAGYHRARLIANDALLAMQPVHILSDGWEPYLYYSYQDPEPVSFRGEPVISGGRLHLRDRKSTRLTSSHVKLSYA